MCLREMRLIFFSTRRCLKSANDKIKRKYGPFYIKFPYLCYDIVIIVGVSETFFTVKLLQNIPL